MTLLRAFSGWIARHALLFVLIVAALAIYAQFRPDPGSERQLKTSIANLEAAERTLRAEVEGWRGRAVSELDTAQGASLAAIDARLAVLTSRRPALAAPPRRGFGLFVSPQDAIVAEMRRPIELALVDQEADFLRRLRANVENRGKALTLGKQIADYDRRIADDQRRINGLPPRWDPRRYRPCPAGLCDLSDDYAQRMAANAAKRDGLVKARRMLGDIAPLATPEVAMAALEAPVARIAAAAQAQRDKLSTVIVREAEKWYKRLGIDKLLWPAFGVLALIILTPFAVRTLFYWVLAPLASLQKPIQLLDSAVPIPLPADRSAVSKSIALAPETELLVRQGFEQTVSLGGTKATQWFLDARHPLSSIVSGLYFLTRIRGQSGDTITVSATEDPFAEVGILALPAGAAAVLQPRAIAGVVQPVATPLRITSHWRLGTLNAWLTWQLRFLVFHGPADIILTGGRGVRIEPALAGRSIGQDQLIGFSAGIAYSTGRTETFIPYLFGREPLLKDRIAAGSGVLIAEEAPRAGRDRAGMRRGLEGAADAILKAFGI